MVLAAVLVVGLCTRLTLPAAWACAIVLNGMVTSTGKVVHNDLVLLLCLVPLLVAPAADAWSLDASEPLGGHRACPRASTAGLRTAAIVVAGAYFAGLAKLVHSGPAWVTSDNLRWALRFRGLELAIFIADRPWLAHALAAGTLLLELGFPLVLFVPRAAWLFVPGAVLFHAGIWIAMGLDHSAQAATAVVVSANWPVVVGASSLEIGARRGGRTGLTSTLSSWAKPSSSSTLAAVSVAARSRDSWLGTGTTGCVPSPCRDPEADELLGGMDKERKMSSWHPRHGRRARLLGRGRLPSAPALCSREAGRSPRSRPRFPRVTERAYQRVAHTRGPPASGPSQIRQLRGPRLTRYCW